MTEKGYIIYMNYVQKEAEGLYHFFKEVYNAVEDFLKTI